MERLSLIYLNTLFLIVCLCFFLWRYKKETAYYKSLIALQDEIGEDWFDYLPSPQSHFPDRIVNRFFQTIYEQHLTKHQNQKSSQQLEQTDLASWSMK
ncbi:two-component sensor histidine kinase BceS [Bacillus sp. JCM 19045]|nr:two-component sensor histidine kinase BceS [Bacillus sp. JCM 19045]